MLESLSCNFFFLFNQLFVNHPAINAITDNIVIQSFISINLFFIDIFFYALLNYYFVFFAFKKPTAS